MLRERRGDGGFINENFWLSVFKENRFYSLFFCLMEEKPTLLILKLVDGLVIQVTSDRGRYFADSLCSCIEL